MSSPAATADITRPLSPHDESRLFWQLRLRTLANLWRQMLSQARLRFTLVLALSVVFWVSLFLLFAEAFQFLLSGAIPLDSYEDVIGTVFGLFFVSLMVMLVFSTGIILYSSLYRSQEAALLLTLPVRPEMIFVHKFQEAVLFSSWGFLLMGTPMLVAYGMTSLAPWWYFAMLAPFMVAFVYLPSAVGAMLCMLIVYRVPTARIHVLGAIGLAAVTVAAWLVWNLFARQESDLLTPLWFQEMMGRLRFSQYRLLPSWWLSSGLLEAAQRPSESLSPALARPPWAESVLFLALLIANSLLMRQLAVWTAARVYRASYSRVHAQLPSRRQIGVAAIDRAVMRYALFLSPTMRLLVVKDLRLFRRDPVQWSQFLIFFGLLSLYFLNVRRFGSNDSNFRTWVNMVSFLNLAVIGLILSTFTTRFIFPMISLEGRRFWILSLLPARRETILWGKFLFASIGSLTTCLLLVILSDVMLGVSPLVLGVHVLSCLMLCVGLSAIAVGLGAVLPNLREDSPSKIAAGFGGTLNLVISTIYIILIVGLTAVPCHFYIAGVWSLNRLIVGVAASLVVAAAATTIPLRAGTKAFRELEF